MIHIKSKRLTCSVCGFSSIDPELFISDGILTTCNACIRKELQMPEVEPSPCKICGKTITSYRDFCDVCQHGMTNSRAMVHLHEWKLTRRERNRYKIYLSNYMVAKYQSVETTDIDILQKRLRSINGAFKAVFTANARKRLTEDYQRFICDLAIADSLVTYQPGQTDTSQESIIIE